MEKKISILFIGLILCLGFFSVVKADSFGKTTIGATPSDNGHITIGANFTLPVNANLNSISLYCSSSDGNVPVNVAIYNNSVNTPNYRIAQSTAKTISNSDSWVTFTLNNEYLTAGTYWLSFGSNSTGATFRVYWDAGEGAAYKASVFCPDPFGASSPLSRIYSIYANYTVYVEPTPTPTPTETTAPTTSDMATSQILATILLVVFIILNIVFLALSSMMVRFLFGLFTLVIAGVTITMQGIVFSPYLQMFTVVMSLLCMFLAARAKD